MATRLYRFRPLSRLLDKGELADQQIFFASPDSLNDPMEGFRDIFWQGDAIVWRNLFRHYLLCLEWAYSLVAIGGEKEPILWKHIPISNVDAVAPTEQYKGRIDGLVSAFFENEAIQRIIDLLAARAAPIRGEELITYLLPIHWMALLTIRANYSAYGLAKMAEPNPATDDHYQRQATILLQLVNYASALDAESPELAQMMASMFTEQQQDLYEIKLIQRYNTRQAPFEANKHFVLFEFPNEYVNRLESLVYPEWYTACFMKECHDSSVWGSYGDNHTAVCLVFKVPDEGSLRLKRQIGFGSSGPLIQFAPHPFYEVTYGAKPPSIDFFRSLGRLTKADTSRTWYTGLSGELSACATEIFANEEAWHERYWANFFQSVTRKLEAWHYEKEMRLILTGIFIDFSDPAKRVAQYDFNDLEGIIFGIKTPTDKKIAICKIIEEKCLASNRKDFKLYQAYYSPEKGCIDHREMTLLKFALPPSEST